MSSIDTLEATVVIQGDNGFPIGMRTAERPPRFIGVPFVLAQDWTPSGTVTGTTAETTVDKQVAIPGGLLGKNGSMRVTAFFQGTNNANSKICQIKLAGQTISGATFNMANNPAVGLSRNFTNRGAENLNVWFGTSSSGVETGASSANSTGINTAIEQMLTFTITLGVATDAVSLAGYRVEIFPSE